jgi:hypothetical protein
MPPRRAGTAFKENKTLNKPHQTAIKPVEKPTTANMQASSTKRLKSCSL